MGRLAEESGLSPHCDADKDTAGNSLFCIFWDLLSHIVLETLEQSHTASWSPEVFQLQSDGRGQNVTFQWQQDWTSSTCDEQHFPCQRAFMPFHYCQHCTMASPGKCRRLGGWTEKEKELWWMYDFSLATEVQPVQPTHSQLSIIVLPLLWLSSRAFQCSLIYQWARSWKA